MDCPEVGVNEAHDDGGVELERREEDSSSSYLSVISHLAGYFRLTSTPATIPFRR